MKKRLVAALVFVLLLTLSYRFFQPTDSVATHPEKACLVVRVEGYFDGLNYQRNGPYWLHIDKGLIVSVYDKTLPVERNESCRLQIQAGYFALPGLIDSHSHVFAFDTQVVKSWQQALTLSALSENYRRLNYAKVNLLSLIQHGFTTVRDLGNSGSFLEREFLLKNSEVMDQLPNLVYSGPGLALAPSQITLKKNTEYLLIDLSTDLEKVVTQYKNHGATWIKVYIDNSIDDHFMSLELLRKLVRTAHEKNLKIAAHAEFKTSSELALLAGVDSVEHFYQIPGHDLKNLNSYIVPTEINSKLCSTLEKKRFNMPSCDQQMQWQKNRKAWLSQRNIPWIFGSDSVLDFTSDYQSRGESTLENLIQLPNFGWTPLAVLQSATSRPAQMLNLPIGSIKPGAVADLVFYSNDQFQLSFKNQSLEFLRKPLAVFKNGVAVGSENNDNLFNLVAAQAWGQ